MLYFRTLWLKPNIIYIKIMYMFLINIFSLKTNTYWYYFYIILFRVICIIMNHQYSIFNKI